MENIRDIYEDAARTTQIYPRTHEKAVIDDNGTPLNNKLGTIVDLVNQKQMEVGAVPSDLAPTRGSTNWVTSGGIKNALDNSTEFTTLLQLGDSIPYIITQSTGKWYDSTASHYVVSVSAGDKIKVTAGTNGARLFWLRSNNAPASGVAAPISTIDGELKVISGNETNTFIAPADAAYLYVMGVYNGTDYTPTSIEKASTVKESIESLQEGVDLLSKDNLYESRIALTNTPFNYYIGGNVGSWTWNTGTSDLKNVAYEVKKGRMYKITANSNLTNRFFFIRSLPNATGAINFTSDNTGHFLHVGESVLFTPPEDCYVTFYALTRLPSAFSQFVEKPRFNLVADNTEVSASDGITLCTPNSVPPNSMIVYDFTVGSTSTSDSCYLRIYRDGGESAYIGKTSTFSGENDYANTYILPSDYNKVTIEGRGSMTINKMLAVQMNVQSANLGNSTYNGLVNSGVIVSETRRVASGTVIFTSDTYKKGDCVHIDITCENDFSGYVTLYGYDDNLIRSYGKLARTFIENNYTLDIEIPYNFAYAKVYATSASGSTSYPQYLFINSIYKVAYECGVFKIGNPLMETLESFNSKTENHINTENVFGTNDGLAKKRVPSVIVTNNGTSIVVAQNKAEVGDSSPSGLIIGRKANGGSWTIDTTTFPYDSSIGSLMNPSFIVDRSGAQGVQGRIYLFALAVTVTQSNGGYAYKCTTNEIAELYSYSDDDGVTWSSFATIPKTAWDTSSYTWMCNAPSNGIITADGTMALACMGRVGGANGVWVSGVMYKPVNGEWQFSQVSLRQGDNESVVFEGIDGDIYINCRNESFNYLRSLYKLNTTDGSLSTIDNGFNPKVKLQCCITKCTIDSDICYLMTFPDPTASDQRNRITVWASADGIRWARVLRMTGNTVTAGYTMISCYNGKCVMVWENDGWDCRTIGYADLTPSLELLKQSSLMCSDTPDERIHRVTCYEKGITI